jgi:hypothetical protein
MQRGFAAGSHCNEIQLGYTLLIQTKDVYFIPDVQERGILSSFTGQMDCGTDFAIYAVEGTNFILEKIHSERASESPGIYRTEDMIHRKSKAHQMLLSITINVALYYRKSEKDKIGIQCSSIILTYV